MTNKKRTIYVKKDKRDKTGERFKALYSDNYASLVDFDLSYELLSYTDAIKARFSSNPELEHKAEFTVPLRHLLQVAKEVSYMLNTYTETPPPKINDYDASLLIFRDTVSIIQTMQDYLDSKLELAKEAIMKDRGFTSWAKLCDYCEAILADLACRGNLKYKKQTNLEKWREKNA